MRRLIEHNDFLAFRDCSRAATAISLRQFDGPQSERTPYKVSISLAHSFFLSLSFLLKL